MHSSPQWHLSRVQVQPLLKRRFKQLVSYRLWQIIVGKLVKWLQIFTG